MQARQHQSHGQRQQVLAQDAEFQQYQMFRTPILYTNIHSGSSKDNLSQLSLVKMIGVLLSRRIRSEQEKVQTQQKDLLKVRLREPYTLTALLNIAD